MEVVHFMDWHLEVDRATTMRLQAEGGDNRRKCECLHCQNFYAAQRSVYPEKFLRLLERLGLSADSDTEVWQYNEIRTGWHSYGGMFHFAGRMVSGPEAKIKGRLRLKHVASRFSVGFFHGTPSWMPHGLTGEVMFLADVPWVLEKPYEDPYKD